MTILYFVFLFCIFIFILYFYFYFSFIQDLYDGLRMDPDLAFDFGLPCANNDVANDVKFLVRRLMIARCAFVPVHIHAKGDTVDRIHQSLVKKFIGIEVPVNMKDTPLVAYNDKQVILLKQLIEVSPNLVISIAELYKKYVEKLPSTELKYPAKCFGSILRVVFGTVHSSEQMHENCGYVTLIKGLTLKGVDVPVARKRLFEIWLRENCDLGVSHSVPSDFLYAAFIKYINNTAIVAGLK